MSSPAPKWFKRLRRLTTFVLSGNRNSRIRREKFLMENGRMLLEESITLFDGKINPIHFFSFQELQNASNEFDEKLVIHDGEDFKLYRCSLQNRMVILKKYGEPFFQSSPIRDIVVASRMSVHKNVMKLIGCCLETQLPILVFDCECTLLQPLSSVEDWIHPLQWKDRLKIAVNLSNLLAYLHTAFPTPIVHRRFYPSLFLPDDYGCLKLFDFAMSIPIPEGESSIKKNFLWTNGFAAPEYISIGEFNEKIDVYSFGLGLLILLSGRKEGFQGETSTHSVDYTKIYEENERFVETLDPKLLEEEPWPGKYNQFEDVLRLALCCVRRQSDDRPDITDIAKKLKEMHQLLMPGS